MDSLERAGFLAHAQTAVFERRVEQAKNIVRRWLDSCENPYVAFSAGKDSTVTLDLVRRQRPDTPAIFCDEEWLLPETLELVGRTENLIRVAKRDEHASWFTAWEDGPKDLPEGVLWAENGFRNTVEGWGHDGCAVGLRADESRMRKTHIRTFGECFRLKRGIWQCYPLAWWTSRDVFAYIISKNLDYNHAYDKLAGMGVPFRERRIGPMAVESRGTHDPLHFGQLAILKRGWPDLYNRFAERFPEARRYV